MRVFPAILRRAPAPGTVAMIGLVIGLVLGAIPFGATGAATPSARTLGVGPIASHAAPAAAALPGASCPGACATSLSTSSLGSEGWLLYSLNHTANPGGRDAPAIAYDARDGYLLMFGGCAHKTCPTGDTWKYQGGAWVNLTAVLPVAPAARYGAVLAYDAHDAAVVLFGGVGTNGSLGDTWEFSGGTWSPTAVGGPAPSARSFAMGAYDPALGRLVVFGGNSSARAPLNDTWAFADGAWTNLTATEGPAPPARDLGVLAYDPADGRAVLFGGTGACGLYCGDTWTLGVGGWTNATASAGTAPPARIGAQMSLDDGLGQVILFGGQNSVALADTWSFHGNRWTDLTLNLTRTPSARSGAGGGFDARDGYYLIFGGRAGTTLRTGTWVLLSPLAVGIGAGATRIAPGEPTNFTAFAQGGLAPYAYTWSFGDGTPPATGALAAHTYATNGSFIVTLAVDDAVGDAVSAQLPITVAFPPLTVALTASATAPRLGQVITLVALAQGGKAPYLYLWGGATGTCHASSPTVETCTAQPAGPLVFSVTATDANGRSATAMLTVAVSTFAPPPANTTPPATTPANPAPTVAASPSPGLLVLLPAAAAIAVAGAIGFLTFRAARRRAASPPRPLCYAVPLWSETPEEYRPEEDPTSLRR